METMISKLLPTLWLWGLLLYSPVANEMLTALLVTSIPITIECFYAVSTNSLTVVRILKTVSREITTIILYIRLAGSCLWAIAMAINVILVSWRFWDYRKKRE